MYRWYENLRLCYAYLHDVSGSSFPTARDNESYPNFDGWPEWFSRGWTLQELIVPSNVQFLNKNWQNIGDKRTLAPILRNIIRVPEHVLIDELRGNRPYVAQTMSWAANRKTTRVEDKAYLLIGLLDVNMPMLQEKGRKHFTVFSWKSSAHRTTKPFLRGIPAQKKSNLAVFLRMTRATFAIVLKWS